MEPVASTSTAQQTPLCAICSSSSAKYTCPRCAMHTCSAACSNAHKTGGQGCSGVRDKAAYVPMNQYGYMALMNDYVFLEDLGRKVGEYGREIVQGGYMASGDGRGRRGLDRGRGRGRGRGAGGGQTRTKRDVLKMQMDFRDIDMELLPNGMERRTLNQSTWDFKIKTALLTVEFRIHPPGNQLAPSSQLPEPPFTFMTHRNELDAPLLSILQQRVAERSKSKKDKSLPAWLSSLVTPDSDVPDAFTLPTFVMKKPPDPRTALETWRAPPEYCERFYKLDPNLPLSSALKHKSFIEFPTIEVYEEGAFHGTLVDDRGALSYVGDEYGYPAKRRKLSAKAGRQAIKGLLGGYGSEDEDDGEQQEESNVLNLLGGYAGSGDEEDEGEVQGEASGQGGGHLVDSAEDSEAEPEGDVQNLAAILDELRQAGALRDPGVDGVLAGLDEGDEEVDWGEDSEDEVY